MKTKQLLLSLLVLLITVTSFSQTTLGIPVQGIARDVNGTARINTAIDLTFDLYYIVGGNEVPLYSPSQIESVTTDSFGVFSSIVNTAGRRSVFNSRAVFLRILESGTVISDEQLNSVPYAIAADNGVPTGAIMPFVSDTIPDGWLLCDGATIPTGEQYDALRALYGNNTPDLKGMFLRGAGTNNLTSVTTVLNATQDDTNSSHSHAINIVSGGQSNDHTHNYIRANGVNNAPSGPNFGANISAGTFTSTGSSQDHTHNVNGNSAASGSSESRPVNYGVNYIIKL